MVLLLLYITRNLGDDHQFNILFMIKQGICTLLTLLWSFLAESQALNAPELVCWDPPEFLPPPLPLPPSLSLPPSQKVVPAP